MSALTSWDTAWTCDLEAARDADEAGALWNVMVRQRCAHDGAQAADQLSPGGERAL